MPERQKHVLPTDKTRGQALVEYALILALVALALAAVMVSTSSAVGNVFSNTVYNLVGQDPENVAELKDHGGREPFWMTVTWVAENPMMETPYEAPTRPPTDVPTPGPSPTPSPTVPTNTPTATPTFTPSPTAVDTIFNLPFVETVDENETLRRWRLDNSIYLGGGAWRGEYFSDAGFGTRDFSLWNYQFDPVYAFTVDFDWGTGDPVVQYNGVTWPNRANPFSIRYTREIYVKEASSVLFTGRAAGGLVVKLVNEGGSTDTLINRNSPNPALSANVERVERNLAAGKYTVIVEYSEMDGGQAGVGVDITYAGGSDAQINPDDDVAEADPNSRCNWGRQDSTNANSMQWMFDEDPKDPNGVGPNLTCHLELRGYVKLEGAANPVMTFWDVWDFSGSGANAKLQIARYTPVEGTTRQLDRTGLQWRDVPLHSGGEANYNWTRQEINLAALGFTSSDIVTFRFTIENPGGTSGYRRWYVDNIRIADETQEETVTIGQLWKLDNPDEKNDFITTARWDLTANNTFGPGLAWDDSPGYSTHEFSQGDPRIHYFEIRDMVTLAPTAANAKDLEEDEGKPILSFWHSYSIAPGTSLEVQWTRDDRHDTIPDNWTTLGGEAVVTATNGVQNGGTSMTFVELPLDAVPQWETQPFRLRFAMVVNNPFPGGNEGSWYVDEIYIERMGLSGFNEYPFNDNVEDTSISRRSWRLGDSWNRAAGEGRQSSSNAYGDSPNGNYGPHSNTSMQMINYFDLNNDSPEHDPKYENTPFRPTLTFWHRRDLAANATFHVDIYIKPAGATLGSWHSVWQYAYGTGANPIAADRQQAWERVQIDLTQAYFDATGVDWPTVISNGDFTDDDIRVAFRMQTTGTETANGVYIDDIRVSDREERIWRLHSGGEGDTYSDSFEYMYSTPSEDEWQERWFTGGNWEAFTGTPRVGLNALTDSKEGTYRPDTISILEMNRIIDLQAVTASDRPVLYFWSRHDVHYSDSISVQIAQRTGETVQGYDRLLGWSPWQVVWPGSSMGTDDRDQRFELLNSGWHRNQIDLSPYLGKEIRIRFVLNSVNEDAAVADGWALDDIRITHLSKQRVFPLGFADRAQSTYNWVAEGDWGLAPDRYRGSSGDFGMTSDGVWEATYIHCDYLKTLPPTNPNYHADGCGPENVRAARYGKLAEILNDPALPTGPNVLRTTYNFDPMTLSYGDANLPQHRPLQSTDPRWNDFWMVRMSRTVRIEETANYTFQLAANDGARAKIVGPLEANPEDQVNPYGTWNVGNLWGPFTNPTQIMLRSMLLQPGTYTVTVEWAETFSNAYLNFRASRSVASFTDSPNIQRNDGNFDIATSRKYSDTALILNGVLDLRNVRQPVLEYYTMYDFGPSDDNYHTTRGRIEVSRDGGFTWAQHGLGDDITNGGETLVMDEPTIVGGIFNYTINPEGWRRMRHNLYQWAGLNLQGNPRTGYGFASIRFRTTVTTRDYDGWYITDIRVNE